MQVFGDVPFVPGLFVAGIFSGALSTVSSALNSLATVASQDLVVGACSVRLSERAAIWTSKILVVAYGFFSYGLVFVVKNLPGMLEAALRIFGIVGGPVLGAFTLGMFCPWANSKGAVVGMLVSLALTMWIGMGQAAAKCFKAFTVEPKETTTELCPAEWLEAIARPNATTPPTDFRTWCSTSCRTCGSAHWPGPSVWPWARRSA